MFSLVAEGSPVELANLGQYESKFSEGDKGELRLFTSGFAPDWALSTLQSSLGVAGVELTDNITQDADIVYIRFKKAIAPLVIIAIAIAAVIVLIGLVIAWQLFRLFQKTPELVLPLILAFIGGGILLGLVLTRRRQRA